jgi:hypothetical protein
LIASQTVEPPPPPEPESAPLGRLEIFASRLNPHYVFLCFLPWFIFFVNPNWLFQGFGHFDPWYYFGMSVNFPRYQHVELLYPGERIAWILPARLFVLLFTPVYGWMLFHVAIYLACAFSVYFLIRRFAGSHAALITAAMMAAHPMFIASNGWANYESGNIAYLLLSLAALGAAAAASRPHVYLVLAGILWAFGAYLNLFWWTFTPCCALFYWGAAGESAFRSSTGSLDLRRCLSAAGSFATGLAIATLVMHVLFYAIYGAEARNFYHEQYSMVQWGTKLKTGQELSGNSSLNWVATAGWVVFPVLTAIASLIALVRHFLGARLVRFALGTVLCYLFAFTVMVVFTFRAVQVMWYDYYTSMLIPLEFLTLGVLAYPFASKLSTRSVWIVVAVSVAISIAPMYQNPYYRPSASTVVWWHYIAGLVVIPAAMFTRNRIVWIAAAIGIGVTTFGLITQFTSQWNSYNYNGLAATRRVAEAMQYVDTINNPHRRPVFWFDDYDEKTAETAEFRSIMCSFVAHFVAMRKFPQIDSGRKFEPGDQLIILNQRKDIFDTANAAMTAAGMPLRPVAQRMVSGEGFGFGQQVTYWLTFVEVVSGPEPAHAAVQ